MDSLHFIFGTRDEARTISIMTEGIVPPSVEAAAETGKPAIDWEEAFFLALAATVMKQTFPNCRKDFEIDESLSDDQAAGVVLARTIVKDFAMPLSARRVWAVLDVFFLEEVGEWFESELNEILRETGSGAIDISDCWPTIELYEAMNMDFAKLVAQGQGRGWDSSGTALKPPYRFYWEEHLQIHL